MTKRRPIGIHKVTLVEMEDHSSSIGRYERTVYLLLDGSHQIMFKGKYRTIEQTVTGSFTGSVDLRNPKRKKK